MSDEGSLKMLHFNRELLSAELRLIESEHDVVIRPVAQPANDQDESFYPQFPQSVRDSARAMAQHYEIFYCLENWLRDQVSAKLEFLAGENWWAERVPETVKDNVEKNATRERDAAMTARSAEPIDYTTFGELSNIIEANWDAFNDTFNSKRGLISVMARLNLLRGPIAHCSELLPDEVARLKLSLADFFRLME